MTENTCGATFDLATDETLTCSLEPGHYGPTHSEHGHEWGDIELPPAPMPEPDDA